MDLHLEQYLMDLSNHAADRYHCFSDCENFEWENEFSNILHKENINSISEFLENLSICEKQLSKIIAELIIEDCKKIIESDQHRDYHDSAKGLHDIVNQMHKDCFSALLSENWEKCSKSKLKKVEIANNLIRKIKKKKEDFKISKAVDKTDKKIVEHLKNLIEDSINIHHGHWESKIWAEYNIILDSGKWPHIIDFLEAFWEEDPHAASIVAQELMQTCNSIINSKSHAEHHSKADRMHLLVSKIHDKYFLALNYSPWEKSVKARDSTLSLAHNILEKVISKNK